MVEKIPLKITLTHDPGEPKGFTLPFAFKNMEILWFNYLYIFLELEKIQFSSSVQTNEPSQMITLRKIEFIFYIEPSTCNFE